MRYLAKVLKSVKLDDDQQLKTDNDPLKYCDPTKKSYI